MPSGEAARQSFPKTAKVAIGGGAGTGKSLISLSAGYQQLDAPYERLLIYRPTHEVSKSMGFLPGGLKEKFAPWMLPVISALKLIIPGGDIVSEKNAKNNRKTMNRSNQEKQGNFSRVKEYFSSGLIDILPINYLRGDSIPMAFIIVDETQNFTPKEADTTVSRLSTASKMVFIGDITPTQIDNPEVSPTTNGLVRLVEIFKGHTKYGHVTLSKSERHPMVEYFIKRLEILNRS